MASSVWFPGRSQRWRSSFHQKKTSKTKEVAAACSHLVHQNIFSLRRKLWKIFSSELSATTVSNWAATQSQASSPQIYSPQGVISAVGPFDPQIESSLCEGACVMLLHQIAVYLKIWMLAGRCRECGPMQQFPLDRKKISNFWSLTFYNRRCFYFVLRIKIHICLFICSQNPYGADYFVLDTGALLSVFVHNIKHEKK